MTPSEFLDAIDAALAKPGRYPLELTAPMVLGQRGKLLGSNATGPVYGYTRRQCRRMQQAIYEAARADMEGR